MAKTRSRPSCVDCGERLDVGSARPGDRVVCSQCGKGHRIQKRRAESGRSAAWRALVWVLGLAAIVAFQTVISQKLGLGRRVLSLLMLGILCAYEVSRWTYRVGPKDDPRRTVGILAFAALLLYEVLKP
jgi:hypothetical protein